MSKGAPRNSDPAFWVAWHQALASIRVRFWRQCLTALGVALGTAFFASMQTLRMTEAMEANPDPATASRLTWLALTSLMMCLVGVSNAMLMSVTERYREIGTIKCIGASDGFIVKVFCLESMLLGAIGATVGALLGTLLMSGVLVILGYKFAGAALFGVVGASIVIGVVLTVLAAIAPAIQAAKMPAAAALRVEV